MAKVSVLMPVYNAGKYLSKAIDSILSQTFTDWEMILINDGSTDNSEDIIAGYDDERIYYIKNPQNLGLIRTLNKAIDLCQGEYIARMDADDISLPDRLKKQVGFLDKHTGHIMCGTNAAVINNQEGIIGKIRNLSGNDFLQIHLLFSVPFIHPSMMIRKNVLQDNRYNEKYKHVEDYELWCRIARLGKIANLKDELFEYRWHDTNVSVLHSKIQEELKDKIIKDQLKKLDIYPTEEELYCHKVTFKLYNLGNKQNVPVNQFGAISKWFSRIITQNNIKKVYDHNHLVAFLWGRWTVLCISQNKKNQILSPDFISFKPAVFIKYINLLLFLRRK